MALTRRKVLQLANETIYGTPPAMDGTNATIAYEIGIPTIDGEPYSRAVGEAFERPMRGQQHGRRRMGYTFSQELRGHPDDYTADTKLSQVHAALQSCGMVGSWLANVWTFAYPANGGSGATAPPSLAGYLNLHGLKWTMKGARGNCVFDLRQGQSAMMRSTFTSLFTTPAAAAMTAPDYATGTAGWEDLAPARVENIAFYPLGALPLQGEFGHMRNLMIDLRSNVVVRESANCSAGTEGVGEVSILGHGTEDDPGIAVSFDVEQPESAAGLGAASWWDAWNAQTLMRAGAGVSLVATVGTAAGNTFVFTMGGLVVKDCSQIDMGDRWGQRIEGRLLGTAASVAEDALIITAT